jgi:hypothetical protein
MRGGDDYTAQCLMCRYQITGRNVVIGCSRFERSKLDADTSTVLAGMLFRMARHESCTGYKRLDFGPDAYRAIDL